MDSTENGQGAPERIGYVLSVIFLLALAALFIYGYAPRIISTIHF